MNLKEKQEIISLHFTAFGEKEGEIIKNLAEDFLKEEDTVSVSIKQGEKIIANALLTPFIFIEHKEVKCYLLAPVAVLPDYQGKGLVRQLIEEVKSKLIKLKAGAVFVLGSPMLYPKFGFVNTDKQTPYPNLLSDKESWMAFEITKGTLEKLNGKTQAIKPFMKPIFWDTTQWTE